MANPRPRLSVFNRQHLVHWVASGWPAAHVADQLGISRATAYKWVRRYKSEGEDGLLARSSRPRRSPRRLSETVEAEILAARAQWRYGPDHLGPLLGRPPSTVHRVLARRGFSRLRDTDRVTTAPVRYVACHPGALVHRTTGSLAVSPTAAGGSAVAGLRRTARAAAMTTSRSSSTTQVATPLSCPSPTRPAPARAPRSRSQPPSPLGSASGSNGS